MVTKNGDKNDDTIVDKNMVAQFLFNEIADACKDMDSKNTCS